MPVVLIDLALTLVTGVAGAGGAWWMRRRTTLCAQNLYLAAAAATVLLLLCMAVRWWLGVLVLLPLAAPALAGAAAGRRWRLSDLGAGEELRNYELGRRWIWEPARSLPAGEKRYLRSQGELIHERPWPAEMPYVSMTKDGDRGPRLPIGQGQHIFLVGATGAGKTTTARRVIAARTLAQKAALLILDQKGDQGDVEQMRRLAAAAGVPFILLDSQDPNTDRWQPLWGTPDSVAARCVEPIKATEQYYYDVLRGHLDIVCKVLHASDRWPPSVPFLIDACSPESYPAILAMAEALPAAQYRLSRRAQRHARYVNSKEGIHDLRGGAKRLETALSLASRQVVTPRITPEGEAVALNLVQALAQRAVVMWRTHADTMPDEAAALSVLALADLHDAAERAGVQWTLLLDEFGAVIDMAAKRGIAILQRARSHGGQVIVVTQSAADIEALTGQVGLLASLTDNFAGIVAHRQTSPESRDWLAKLMGTRAIWQSTNQTAAHGTQHSGRGSARRTREFRVGADIFS
ncbi:MAG: type IV secretion system DNA-binding domain-containing protein, partial [Solirubrobacteraceae bacterium]